MYQNWHYNNLKAKLLSCSNNDISQIKVFFGDYPEGDSLVINNTQAITEFLSSLSDIEKYSVGHDDSYNEICMIVSPLDIHLTFYNTKKYPGYIIGEFGKYTNSNSHWSYGYFKSAKLNSWVKKYIKKDNQEAQVDSQGTRVLKNRGS